MLVDLSDRAQKLLADEVDRLGPKADTIFTTAHAKTRHVSRTYTNGTNTSSSNVTVTYTMRGLYTADKNALAQIINTCEQIINAAQSFAEVTAPPQASQFTAISAKAEKVGITATRARDDDYSEVDSNGATVPLPK